MFAMALLDVPFDAPKHKTDFKKARMTLTAGGPLVVFHQEINPAARAPGETPVLVSQNFFRRGDRYRYVNNERVEKNVTEEFLHGAERARETCRSHGIMRAYLKERSPSCGVRNTHVDGKLTAGRGVTAEVLQRAGVVPIGIEGLRVEGP